MAEAIVNESGKVNFIIIPQKNATVPDEIASVIFEREIPAFVITGKQFIPPAENQSQLGFRITPGSC